MREKNLLLFSPCFMNEDWATIFTEKYDIFSQRNNIFSIRIIFIWKMKLSLWILSPYLIWSGRQNPADFPAKMRK